jgi:cytochrome P450
VRRPPGPRSSIPGKDLFDFVSNPLRFLERAARASDDVVYFRLGGRSHYLLRRPEDIKDVMIADSANFTIGYVLEKARVVMGEGLVNSEEPLHARQRRLVQRSFNKQRIAGYATTMVTHAEALSAAWHDGQETDVHQDMVRLSLGIVMKTLFNTDAEVEAKSLGAHFKVILENSLLLFALPYPETLLRLPIPRLRAIARAIGYLDSTIYRMVAERRRTGRDEGDLLSAFIGGRDVEGDGGGMSDRQINPYLIHRDVRYFRDPERFDPERFAPGGQASRHAFSYLPFGAGVRSCVGEGYAWLADVLVLAVLVRDWKFQPKK